MAFTATKVFSTVWGNKQVRVYNVAADAASGSVQTGLQVIEACWISPVSCTTNAQNVKSNLTAGSTAALGSIFISSCVSTDVFTLVAIGH
jgi:hypothetical protein